MSFAEYTAALRRQWRLVGAVTGICVLVALIWSQLATPTYRATSTVFFSVAVGESSGDLARGERYTRAQVRSFAAIATMPVVLDEVRAELDLPVTTEQLRQRVTARTPVGTVVVHISVQWPGPRGASVIADAVASRLAARVRELSPSLVGPTPEGSDPVRAVAVSRAALPTAPASPRPRLDVAVAVVVGLLLGACLAWQRESLDRRAEQRALVRRLAR
jgi:succinoglycan biosynthesis transport protein ExoP